MTEVTVRTEDAPDAVSDVIPDVVDNHEMRLQDLETSDVTTDIDHSIAMDQMSTRIRDLETRLEMATKKKADDAPPDDAPDDVPAFPETPGEPDQPDVPDPDTVIEDDPEVTPDSEPDGEPEIDPGDPTTNPALNPQGEVTEVEKEVETPAVKKTTRVRKTPVSENIPRQKKGLSTFILGGSGGIKRTPRKKASR